MADVATLICDHAQRRVAQRAMLATWLGRELLRPEFAEGDAWCDPISNTCMLRPAPFDAQWYTSNAGRFAKLSIASGYTVKTSAKWVETEDFVGAGKYLHCSDSAGEYARTTSALGVNRGMFVSIHLYSAGDTFTVAEFGWSDSTSPTAETANIGFRLGSDGKIQVYKSGEFVAQGQVTGAAATAKEINHVIDFILLPFRRRQLLICSTAGNGFIVTFDDIDESDTAPVITPATKFFMVPGVDNTLHIQFAPLTFPTTATLKSETFQWSQPPRAEQTQETGWVNPVFTGVGNASIYGDKAYAGTTNVSSVTLIDDATLGTFVADGIKQAVRTHIVMTGDGSYSPFIYGAIFEYLGWVRDTNSAEQTDLSEWATGYSIEVPDCALDDSVGVALKYADTDGSEVTTLLTDVMKGPVNTTGRPVKLSLGSAPLLIDGEAGPPKFTDSIRDENARLAWQIRSRYAKALERFRFRDKVAVDGWPLCQGNDFSAVRYVLQAVGVHPSRLVLSNLNYTIGEVPSEKLDEWNLAFEVGDTGRDALEKLFNLAGDCVYGTHPSPSGADMDFWFLAPDDLPTDPVITLYRDLQDAMDALGLPAESAIYYLYYGFHEEPLEIEANEVWATGRDARTGLAVQSWAKDTNSQDPTLAPSARPENWLGDSSAMGVANKMLRRQTDTEAAVAALLPLVTAQPKVCGFGANTLLGYTGDGGGDIPVWRMDLVRLDGIGDRRISSLCADLRKEIPEGRIGAGFSRDARYTGGTIRGLGGTTVAELQSATAMRRAHGAAREYVLASVGGLQLVNSQVRP